MFYCLKIIDRLTLLNRVKWETLVKNQRFYSILQPSTYPSLEHRKKPVLGPLLLQPNRSISIEGIIQGYASIFQSIADSKAAEKTEQLLVAIHDTTGLPWWGSIVLTTCCLRLFLTVPLSIYQSYVLARLDQCKAEMASLVEELKKETALAIKMYSWTEKETKLAYNASVRKQWRLLIEKYNCHPLKSTMVFWIQLPLWIVFSCTLRNMVYRPKDILDAQIVAFQFQLGGVFWAPNLFLPDHSLILPLSLGVINLIIIELQTLTRLKEPTKLNKIITNLFRGFTLVLVPIAATAPSCLSLYWTSSSLFGLVQNLVLMSPKLKRLCGIPKTESELDHPYRTAFEALKNRWYFFGLFRKKV